jgi:hypothetical protein
MILKSQGKISRKYLGFSLLSVREEVGDFPRRFNDDLRALHLIDAVHGK